MQGGFASNENGLAAAFWSENDDPVANSVAAAREITLTKTLLCANFAGR